MAQGVLLLLWLVVCAVSIIYVIYYSTRRRTNQRASAHVMTALGGVIIGIQGVLGDSVPGVARIILVVAGATFLLWGIGMAAQRRHTSAV